MLHKFTIKILPLVLVITVLTGCNLFPSSSEKEPGTEEISVSLSVTAPSPTASAAKPSPMAPSTVSNMPSVTAPSPTISAVKPCPTAPSAAPTAPAPSERPASVDALLQTMTLRQKVGQLFIVCPEALSVSKAQETGVTVLTESMKETLGTYPVGGIIMFSANIVSPSQITDFNKALQEASKIPLFLVVDEEGGRVARLANHPAFDLPKYRSAAAVGASGDAADALEMGSTIGAYLRRYGFNMDFAPDADVNTNPDNPVIGTRAFSSDAKIAAKMAGAMAEGLRKQGIISTFKHFPGHGDTAEDSHKGIAVSYKTEAEMKACEWLPFAEAGSGDCIMVGHIAVPDINQDLTPATMSRAIVQKILKEQLGFRGLVITDSLSMKAITDAYTPGEAALGALRAGCDILLMPDDLQEAFDAVVSAVENGTFPERQLDETVRRILKFKQEHGLLNDF